MSDDPGRGARGEPDPGAFEEKIDLSALDPRADVPRFEAMMRELRRAAGPELVRRSAGPSLWDQLMAWRRPVLAASGLMGAAFVAVLVVFGGSPSGGGRTPSGSASAERAVSLGEALGVPGTWAQWLETTTTLEPADLLDQKRSAR